MARVVFGGVRGGMWIFGFEGGALGGWEGDWRRDERGGLGRCWDYRI